MGSGKVWGKGKWLGLNDILGIASCIFYIPLTLSLPFSQLVYEKGILRPNRVENPNLVLRLVSGGAGTQFYECIN